MAVVGARARLELLPTNRRWFLSATRRWRRGRAGCLAARESRLAETGLASAQPKNQAPNAGAKRPHQSRSDWLVRL